MLHLFAEVMLVDVFLDAHACRLPEHTRIAQTTKGLTTWGRWDRQVCGAVACEDRSDRSEENRASQVKCTQIPSDS